MAVDVDRHRDGDACRHGDTGGGRDAHVLQRGLLPALYLQTDTGLGVVHADLATYIGAGSPTPVPTLSNVVRYAWSSTLFARTRMGPYVIDHPLDLSEWARLGTPTATAIDWIPEYTALHRYSTSPAIIAVDVVSGATHELTFPEWVSSGFRAPIVDPGGPVALAWYPSEVGFYDRRATRPRTGDRRPSVRRRDCSPPCPAT